MDCLPFSRTGNKEYAKRTIVLATSVAHCQLSSFSDGDDTKIYLILETSKNTTSFILYKKI